MYPLYPLAMREIVSLLYFYNDDLVIKWPAKVFKQKKKKIIINKIKNIWRLLYKNMVTWQWLVERSGRLEEVLKESRQQFNTWKSVPFDAVVLDVRRS